MDAIQNFEKHLRHALDHLYEPEILRYCPLKPLLMKNREADTPMDFSQYLVNSIESVKPGPGTSVEHPSWRIYELLSFRYVQCAKQADLARQFSCSVRQLRREQERAITVLAERILKQMSLAETDLQGIIAFPEKAAGQSSPLEGEYQWLSETGQSELINLGEELRVLYTILQPLVQKSGLEIVHSNEEAIVRAAIPSAALRQALISVVTTLILNDSARAILIKNNLEREKASIQIICEMAGEGQKSSVTPQDLEEAEMLLRLGKGSIQTRTVPGSQIVDIVFPVMVIKKVVVVDDNMDVLQLLERYAKNSRYLVIPCNQPDQAVALVEQELPDCIVLDVMMRDLDGWQLYQQIRESSYGSRPMIFCSVLAQERLARILGANDYLRKPISRDDFLAALDRQWQDHE